MKTDVPQRCLLPLQTPTREFPAGRGKWTKKTSYLTTCIAEGLTSADEDGTAAAPRHEGEGNHRRRRVTITVADT